VEYLTFDHPHNPALKFSTRLKMVTVSKRTSLLFVSVTEEVKKFYDLDYSTIKFRPTSRDNQVKKFSLSP